MKQEEIIAGNKLIAAFLGRADKFVEWEYENKSGRCVRYNSDWLWLMEVVEKIEELGHDTNIVFIVESRLGSLKPMHHCTIEAKDNCSQVACTTGDTKINAVWRAVIQFITWYNAQSK